MIVVAVGLQVADADGAEAPVAEAPFGLVLADLENDLLGVGAGRRGVAAEVDQGRDVSLMIHPDGSG
jgi:hypothetical protein